jgi:hypothetical protein
MDRLFLNRQVLGKNGSAAVCQLLLDFNQGHDMIMMDGYIDSWMGWDRWTDLLTYVLTYLLTYLLHGAESFLRS